MKELKLEEPLSKDLQEVAKSLRFEKSVKFLYPQNSKEELETFINCYRFFENLKEFAKSEGNSEFSKKVDEYLSDKKQIFNYAFELSKNLNVPLKYLRRESEEELDRFIQKNHNVIINLINTYFPIGREVKKYDPASAVGVKKA